MNKKSHFIPFLTFLAVSLLPPFESQSAAAPAPIRRGVKRKRINIFQAINANDLTTGRQLLKEDPRLVVNAVNDIGETSLTYAVDLGREDFVRLLAGQPHIDLEAKYGFHRYTPLSLAVDLGASPEIVEILLEHGASLSARDLRGRTPLGIAKSTNNEEMIKLLQSYGAKE